MSIKTMDIVTVSGARATRGSIFERATNAVTQIGLSKIAAKIPDSARKHLPLARKFMSGGISGVIDAGLDSLFERAGIGGTLLPGSGATGPSELIGGITLAEARKRFEDFIAVPLAKKNLFCLRIRNIQGGDPLDINMFAIDVSYSGFTIQGDAVHVGSGSFDVVTNSERREMRVTTMDDISGTVKRFCKERHDKMCHPDGTFGLPIDYVFRVDLLHAYIDEEIDGAADAFVDSFVMRMGSLDNEKSRREDGMEEIQLTFVQWDTFAALS